MHISYDYTLNICIIKFMFSKLINAILDFRFSKNYEDFEFRAEEIQPYSSLSHRRPRFLFPLNEALTKQIAFDMGFIGFHLGDTT